jgi:AcrR family transcriptional regulator
MPARPRNNRSGPAWENRRAEIVEAAARLFDRDGYAQTNMYAIAEAAGLQKASLYHYFKSKTDLLVQVHGDYIQFVFDLLETVPRETVPPDERLQAVVRHIVTLMKTHRHFVRIFFEYFRELPPQSRRELAIRRRRYREEIIDIVRDGIAQSIFRDVDPYYATMAIFGMCNWVYQWYEADPGGDPDHIAEIFWDLIWGGLAAEPQAKSTSQRRRPSASQRRRPAASSATRSNSTRALVAPLSDPDAPVSDRA